MTTPRTLSGDLMNARETVRAAGSEIPEWLIPSKLTNAQSARYVRQTLPRNR